MALESGTYINSLNVSNPAATDGLGQADDHMRLIKSTIKSTFPSITGAVTTTQAELNVLDGITATTAELNILDGVTSTTAELNILDGVTATTTEINRLDGVTSNVQTQLNSKVSSASPTFTGTTTIATISMSPFTISVGSDNRLDFKYGTTTVMSLDTSGNLRVAGSIDADTTA